MATDISTYNKKRLVYIGMRGLPADLPKAGGGERETEAKAVRLAQRGYRVTVYCRWHYNRNPKSPFKGIRLISLPSIPTKNLDTVSHTLIATLHAILNNTGDIINYHGMGNALFIPLAKIGGKKTVLYMDGVDWERPKWNKIASGTLKIAAQIGFKLADVVYVDNNSSKRIFEELFSKNTQVITLAADLWEAPGEDALSRFRVTKEKYILFVGLFRQDKGIDLLIKAYNTIDTELPLILVGDNPDDKEYVGYLKKLAGKNILFPGFVYGNEARQLFANCYLYVQPSVMEGNSPALMSAMACGRCVVVNGIEQNRETIDDAGIAFKTGDVDELRTILSNLIDNPLLVIDYGKKARNRIEKVYNWENVVDQLEQVYKNIK
jgi:glycosyltransferase involved in cell wall biosynthesis